MNDPTEPHSIEEEEERCRALLLPQYSGHGMLVRQAMNLIANILNAEMPMGTSEMTDAKRVAITLMVRLFNELRAVLLLCENGYALQAYSQAASIYEIGWTMAWMGDDESRAQNWLQTTAEDKLLDVWARTQHGLKRLMGKDEIDDKTVNEHYSWYKELCLAKHMNPGIQQHEGYSVDDTGIMFNPGPSECTEEELRKGWWVCETAVRFTYPAVWTYIRTLLKEEFKAEAIRDIRHLESESKKCAEWSQERFGEEDDKDIEAKEQ